MDRFFNPFPHDSDGAHHISLGRFIMPFPKAQSSGRSTAKALTFYSVIACILLLGITFCAAYFSYEDKAAIPYHDALTDAIGMSVSAVSDHLDLNEPPVAISDNVYALPKSCSYAKIDFDILLYFEENEDLLKGFAYQAAYTADDESAARDIARFYKKLSNTLSGLGNPKTEHLTKADLLASFDKKSSFHREISQEYRPNHGAVCEYLDHLDQAEFWEGRVGGYLTVPAHYYLNISIDYSPEDQQVSLQLRYNVGPRSTGVLAK